MVAMTEIKAKDIGTGLEQGFDIARPGGGRAKGGDDLGAAKTSHAPFVTEAVDQRHRSLSMAMARKSLTLVKVGPVTIWVPKAANRPWPSLPPTAARSRPTARACAPASGGSSAPATSAAPSTPSVSQASAGSRPAIGALIEGQPNANRNSTLRPPTPSPRTVTVSPPDNNTTGARRWPRPGGGFGGQ